MTITPHAPEAHTFADASGVHVHNAPGTTEISVRTLERIVAQAIKAVPGTVSIDSKLAGIGGRGYPRTIVQADPESRMAAIESTIAVTWPSPVTQIAAQTRAAIIAALEQFTGYSTTRVNITVGHLEPSGRVAHTAVEAPVNFYASIPAVSPTRVVHPVTTSSSESVKQYDANAWTNRAKVASVEVPQPARVHSVSTPPEAVIRPSGEVSNRLEEVIVPDSAPRELELKKVEVPKEQPLREIHVESANPEPVRVQAPEPVQLRHIEVSELEVRSPEIRRLWS